MTGRHSLFGPLDPAPDAGYDDHPPRMGFFTDTSICIGCKACEVACKEWNDVPEDGFDMLGMSYDNTGSLNANTWRHVAFIEQPKQLGDQEPGLRQPPAPPPVELGMPEMGAPGVMLPDSGTDDVEAGLPLADVLRRVQALHARRLPRRLPDRVAVPHRVRHGRGAGGHLQRLRLLRPGLPVRRDRAAQGPDGRKNVGIAQKCTLCYDRLGAGADAGVRAGLPDPVDPVRRRRGAARAGRPARRDSCTRPGIMDARLYGNDPTTASAGPARSSCCSTSPRSTASRPTRS